MHLDWADRRCILCLQESNLSTEHIIPRSLGGVLTVRFLCKQCNEKLGACDEAAAKEDPSIRVAIERVRKELPAVLVAKLTDGQDYYSRQGDEIVHGFLKNGEFKAKPRRDDQGGLHLPTPETHKLIMAHLRKAGRTQESINKALKRFDAVPDDMPIDIDGRLRVTKRPITSVEPSLQGKMLGETIVLKIAYEFAAILIGAKIYQSAPSLEEARTVLAGKKSTFEHVGIERLHSNSYRPFHGLGFDGNFPDAVIQIRLFDWIAFRVCFQGLRLKVPQIYYTHRLDEGKDGFWEVPGAAT